MRCCAYVEQKTCTPRRTKSTESREVDFPLPRVESSCCQRMRESEAILLLRITCRCSPLAPPAPCVCYMPRASPLPRHLTIACTRASPPAAQAPHSNAAALLLHQRPPPRSLASPDFAHATTACRSHSPRHLARVPRRASSPPARAREARPMPRQRPCHSSCPSRRPQGSSRRSARLGHRPSGIRPVSYTHLTLPTICSV